MAAAPEVSVQEMDSKIPEIKTTCLQSNMHCVVCYQLPSIFSIAECNHLLCYKCSTTLRIVCKKKTCPICRSLRMKVYFSRTFETFENLEKRKHSLYNKKYGIVFENMDVKNIFEKMISIHCKKCHEKPSFPTFELLIDHMEISHRKYHCFVCVKNEKMLTQDIRWYKYNNLTDHMTYKKESNTGHPFCDYCDLYFYDSDEYEDHLNNIHRICFICQENDLIIHFNDLDNLLQHFKEKHYSCRVKNCVIQYQSVFRTEEKLNAHYTKYHSNQTGIPNTNKSKGFQTYIRPSTIPYERVVDEYSTRLLSGPHDSKVHITPQLSKEYKQHTASMKTIIETIMKEMNIPEKKINITDKKITKKAKRNVVDQSKIQNQNKKLDPIGNNLATSSKTENGVSAQYPSKKSKAKIKPGQMKDCIEESNDNDKNVKCGANINNEIVGQENNSTDKNQHNNDLIEPFTSTQQTTAKTQSNVDTNKNNSSQKKKKTKFIPLPLNWEESDELFEKWDKKYIMPVNMAERKKAFKKRLMSSFHASRYKNNVEIEEFKKLQKAYRMFMMEEIGANRFFDYFMTLFCSGPDIKLYIELIFLCPDISKQQILYANLRAYRQKTWSYLNMCKFCHQIFSDNDKKHHYNYHKENHQIQ